MAKSMRALGIAGGPRADGPRTIAILGANTGLSQRIARALSADKTDYHLVGDSRAGADLIIIASNCTDELGVAEEASREARAGMRAPLMIVAPAVTARVKAAALQAGADDCVGQGVHAIELRARAAALIRRSACDRAASPLTGLPGNVQLEEDLKACLANDTAAALMAVDVRDFKPFNDQYGYARGDKVLQFLARILGKCAASVSRETRSGAPEPRVYHIGGDDFFVVAQPEQIPAMATQVIAAFDAQAATFYDVEDVERGCVVGVDRSGRPARFPLIALSIAAVTWRPGEATHVGELARLLAGIKATTRKRRGSVFACRSGVGERS